MSQGVDAMDEGIDALNSTQSVVDRLSRPSRLTPERPYPMVCGTPVQGLYVRVVSRCECGVERFTIVPVVVNLRYDYERAYCLNCRTFRTAFVRLEFGSL